MTDKPATLLFLSLVVLAAMAMIGAIALQVTDNDSTQAWAAFALLAGALVGQFAPKPGPPPPM